MTSALHLIFMFIFCRILASLKHPHIVAFHESFFDAAEKVLFIIQVNLCCYYCDSSLIMKTYMNHTTDFNRNFSGLHELAVVF